MLRGAGGCYHWSGDRRNPGSHCRLLWRNPGGSDHAKHRYPGSCSQYADGDCYRIRSRTEYLESDAGSGNYERAAVCTYYKGCGTDCEEPGICRSVEGHRVIKQKDYF